MLPQNTYLFCDWKKSGAFPPPPVPGGTVVAIDDYTIMDAPPGKFDLMVDDEDDHHSVFAKVSSRKASNFSNRRRSVRELIMKVKKTKPRASCQGREWHWWRTG